MIFSANHFASIASVLAILPAIQAHAIPLQAQSLSADNNACPNGSHTVTSDETCASIITAFFNNSPGLYDFYNNHECSDATLSDGQIICIPEPTSETTISSDTLDDTESDSSSLHLYRRDHDYKAYGFPKQDVKGPIGVLPVKGTHLQITLSCVVKYENSGAKLDLNKVKNVGDRIYPKPFGNIENVVPVLKGDDLREFPLSGGGDKTDKYRIIYSVYEDGLYYRGIIMHNGDGNKFSSFNVPTMDQIDPDAQGETKVPNYCY